MRVAPCLLLMFVIGLSGCSSFGKKATGSNNGGARPAPAANTAPPPPYTGSIGAVNPPPTVNGVLAGQVIDGYQRRLNSTIVQVVETDGARPGAPIEVPVDNQGYFTVQGLQAGRRYQLTARARAGSQVLSGSTWATPPDPRLVIRLNDDIAAPSAPSAAGNPPPPNWGNGPAANNDNGWGPAGNNRGRAAELGPPVGARPPPAQPTPPPAPQSFENVVEGKNLASRESPEMKMPAQTPREASPPNNMVAAVPQPLPIAPPSIDPGPARVPSCVLTGQTLHNFALNDLNGRPYEFRHHRGRVVLIDFWGTWCIPCLHSIPHLNILQDRYGSYGLEVIGIAYEGGTPLEQARKVNDVRQRLRINYQLLLGSDRANCPVKTQFAVNQFPTLVLLDERGKIIWRGEGLDQQRVRELEIIIRQRLGLQ